MIDRDTALESARKAIHDLPVVADSLFAPWSDATVSDPIVVRTVRGEPSYWLVPVTLQAHVVGFVRVNGDGAVAAVGAYYSDARRIAASPTVVTRIEASTASALAAAHVHAARGETAATPVYVHDGAPGREAWMIEVSRHGRPTRWIFVIPGSVYERPAGTERDSALE